MAIYRGFEVSLCDDNGIEREDALGNPIICEGYYCEVYALDESGILIDDSIDNFCLVKNVDYFEGDTDSLCDALRSYIDDCYYTLLECRDEIIATIKTIR